MFIIGVQSMGVAATTDTISLEKAIGSGRMR
jgi:hypothetical protein